MTWARIVLSCKLQEVQLLVHSKNAVDGSTAATTDTLPLKIVDFVDGPDSAVGDYIY